MEDCIFCTIVAGRAPASIIYEDDRVITIMDIGPVNPGHVLVMPRQHFPYLADMDAGTGMHLFQVTMRMAAAIRRSGVRCEGINLFLADGEAAFQEIFHVHMHVIPRYKGDNFRIHANWGVHSPREKLDEIAAWIRRADGFHGADG
jgi:histidine triad (HIT) family protein